MPISFTLAAVSIRRPTGAEVVQQLPLPISLSSPASFSNFLVGKNAAAVHLLRLGKEPFVYLWGPLGSGRSHLLQAACHAHARAGGLQAYLPLADLAALGTAVLEDMEQMGLICLDDLQAVAGDVEWEEALFHLYNRVRVTGGSMLASADCSPAALKIQLPDLHSRLAWGPVFQLHMLDDDGRLEALRMHASGRGLELDDEVGNYLLRHCSRDMHKLYGLLGQLDRASMIARQRLTIPFVRKILGTGAQLRAPDGADGEE